MTKYYTKSNINFGGKEQMTNTENIEEMVRDFCSVAPKSKSEVRQRIQQAIAEDRARVENILDKYYAYRQEDGSYTHDPQGNQLIDIIRTELLASLDNLTDNK